MYFGVHSTSHSASYLRKTHQYHAKAGFSVHQMIALHISQCVRNCLSALRTLYTFSLLSPGQSSVLRLEVNFVIKDAFTSPGTQTTCMHLDIYDF